VHFFSQSKVHFFENTIVAVTINSIFAEVRIFVSIYGIEVSYWESKNVTFSS